MDSFGGLLKKHGLEKTSRTNEIIVTLMIKSMNVSFDKDILVIIFILNEYKKI
jgi:hypothetical protein